MSKRLARILPLNCFIISLARQNTLVCIHRSTPSFTQNLDFPKVVHIGSKRYSTLNDSLSLAYRKKPKELKINNNYGTNYDTIKHVCAL